jgi:hypothetical protein
MLTMADCSRETRARKFTLLRKEKYSAPFLLLSELYIITTSAGINVVQAVASYRRVPMILLRKTGTFSEMSIKNVGRLGRGEWGHIFKIRFSTDELPLIHTRVL